eukprot:TRINITY_DN67216_c9_g1_i1.p2 TRINITY_DN67216_c9_g1~~TRINITY_DN67216_c9_g1_i1.p2  ORF type:complete len:345 (+),score=53.24 TRINITY_DN67216_c9_g1_i1:81-1115(+)
MDLASVKETVFKAVDMLSTMWSSLEQREKELTESEEKLNKMQADAQQRLHEEEEKLAAVYAEKQAEFNDMISRQQEEFGKSDENGEPEPGVVVKLNVGGTVFTTTKQTLLNSPKSFFSGMVSSGVWQPNKHTGEFFIDRDPQFFKEILNYLRQGRLDGNLYGLISATADAEPGTPTSSKPTLPKMSPSLSKSEKQLLMEQIDFLQIESLLPAAQPQCMVEFVAFAQWDFDSRKQSHTQQEERMKQASIKAGGTRAATLEEFRNGLIHNHTAAEWPSDSHTNYLLFAGGKACASNQTRLGCMIQHAKRKGPACNLTNLCGTSTDAYFCAAVHDTADIQPSKTSWK